MQKCNLSGGLIEHFNRFYTPEVIARILRQIPESERNKNVPYFLVGESSGATIRRECLNNYLEVGFRHQALDADLTRRLQSANWEQFIQARNELMAAWYSESELDATLNFRPQGSGNSVGEFSMTISNAPSIFVEVKSPWRQAPESQVWSGHDGRQIRQNVDRARRQLPNDQPTLVIVSGSLPGGLSDPLSGMIQALYGEPVIQVPVGPGADMSQTTESLVPSGLFQPTANTRISAVATLEELIGSPYMDSVLKNILSSGQVPIDENAPMDILKYAFNIYHNPYARHPISAELFEGRNQFLPSADRTRMEWKLA